jgi:transposase
MQITPHRKHSDEFKRMAVQQSLNSPDTVKSVALSLGIHPGLLSKWRRKLTSKTHTQNPIKNQGPDKSFAELEREIKELKKRLELAEMENEFLKEAKAYFDSQKE